ncbi:MAG: glutathione S-transferase [Alphaproteobacteria bacterium]|nr:glutathione S-transferase [Alphaproteobacteria bacterium]
MTDTPILYSFRRCPYAMRARMALWIGGTVCRLREVQLSDKPAALLAASAKATVPVLVLPDGTVIDQSLDIARWALARNDPESWLDYPPEADALIVRNDGAFKHHLDRWKYHARHPDEDPDTRRASALAIVQDLDIRLGVMGGGLCGARRTWPDIAIFPFIRQFARHDQSWFDTQPLPHLHRWLAELVASPLFTATMREYAIWREGDSEVIFGQTGQTVSIDR